MDVLAIVKLELDLRIFVNTGGSVCDLLLAVGERVTVSSFSTATSR